MNKEIGSIFPLASKQILNKSLAADCVYMSLCREILLHISRKSYINKVVLLPAYTCDTVYISFIQEGWSLKFYSITKDLRINDCSLREMVNTCNPSIVVAHPYFGYEFNSLEKEVLSWVKQTSSATIVVDNTQCAFTKTRYPFADYTIASLRKWGPMPDGAYMEGEYFASNKCENDTFVEIQKKAMELRNEYFNTGDGATKIKSIQLNKKAEMLICSNIEEHLMSHFSQSLYADWDVESICQKRVSNYSYLQDYIQGIHGIQPVRNDMELSTAPLYFPIYCEDRAAVQKKLAEESIYCPIIWPVENDFVLIDDDVKYIYDHILCLIVDQRYGESDMRRIVEMLKK